ncbi:MAG: hypothetical protein VX000_06125, partial [Myxococcota bacterium]|nr:hypothetical protein [Myxococcota bacterium]
LAQGIKPQHANEAVFARIAFLQGDDLMTVPMVLSDARKLLTQDLEPNAVVECRRARVFEDWEPLDMGTLGYVTNNFLSDRRGPRR